MNQSASEEASFESSDWPEIFANAFTASSCALCPRRSGEKYRCRNEARLVKGEFLAVLLVPGLEFGRRGLVSGGHVLGQELHLLCHAALDDGIVLVEAHGRCLRGRGPLRGL